MAHWTTGKRQHMDIRKDYQKEFIEKERFGMVTMIDAKSCNDYVKDENKIHSFVLSLCDIIDMKRFGNCEIVHFGNEIRVSGYTAVQKIETSLISGHFVDGSQDAYIDVFSCKCYDPYNVREFVKMFFKPRQLVMHVTNRG